MRLSTSESTQVKVGRGALIAGVVLALPGVRLLLSGEASQGLRLLVLPVVIGAIGLCLTLPKSRVPVIVGGAVLASAALIGVSFAVAPKVEADPAGVPTVDPKAAAIVAAVPTSVEPAAEETAWLPPRESMTASQQALYDEYTDLFAEYEAVATKAQEADAAASAASREYKAMDERYKKDQVSYAALMNQYDRQKDAYDRSVETTTAATDLGNQVVVLRREMESALTT